MNNPNRPFGWRKRIGLLSPTVIETAAYDFYRLAPDGVSMCATTSNIELSESVLAGRRIRQQETCKPLISVVHLQYCDSTSEQEMAGQTCPRPARARIGGAPCD
jgi:hypothetical protein